MNRWTFGLDADDTLWQNEVFFRATQDHVADLLADFAPQDHLMERLVAAERRNLGHYGFGIKGFTLSLIETAIEISDGRAPASLIAEILAAGREMLAHPVELLPHARAAVAALRDRGETVVITKGDLKDQERKLAESGLGDLFDAVEIVSDKTPEVYARIFARHGARRALMAGNSLRSDVIPAIAAGAHGVHIPHPLTWEIEAADAPEGEARFHAVADLAALPGLIAALDTESQD